LSSRKAVHNLGAEVVFDKRVGLVKITVTNKSGTTVFIEAIKVFYTRMVMIGIVIAILLLTIIVVGVFYHTEDVVNVVNTLLTLGVIVVGILGRKLGQKTIVKNIRVLMGSGETYTITLPTRKKPSSIEVHTNKGILKPRIKEMILRPKHTITPTRKTGRREQF